MQPKDILPHTPKASKSWRIGIVASQFHKTIVDHLVLGAVNVLTEAGLDRAKITIVEAAGSFEVPFIGSSLAEAKTVDALIGLGVIVDGVTHHAELIARAVAQGIMDTQLKTGIPFAFEILSVKSVQQAVNRAKGKNNRGAEAARAVLHSLHTLKKIRFHSKHD